MNLIPTEKQALISILKVLSEALKKKNLSGEASFIESIIEKIK